MYIYMLSEAGEMRLSLPFGDVWMSMFCSNGIFEVMNIVHGLIENRLVQQGTQSISYAIRLGLSVIYHSEVKAGKGKRKTVKSLSDVKSYRMISYRAIHGHTYIQVSPLYS